MRRHGALDARPGTGARIRHFTIYDGDFAAHLFARAPQDASQGDFGEPVSSVEIDAGTLP